MERLIEGLRRALGAWRAGAASPAAVTTALRGWPPSAAALRPWARFDPSRYRRQRLYRDDDFELLLLCWERGQATPIHDHDGQTGWFTVVAGALAVQNFERRGGPADLSRVTFEAPLGPGGLTLHKGSLSRLERGATVCEAAAPETIHRVGSAGGRALSLHVYARPLDAFLVFDERDGACRRVRCAA